MDNVVKLKNLMVSACKAVQDGHRDIAMNLMEVAADVMSDVDPEIIETQFNTHSAETPDTSIDVAADDVEEMEPEVASKSMRDILSGWDFKHAANG